MIPYKNVWYFWHHHIPNYDARMKAMSDVANSDFTKYAINNILKLVPKE